MDDDRTLIIEGATARDYGKRFRLTEVDPLSFSGFVLRLVAALKVGSYEELLTELTDAVKGDAKPPIDLVMQVLAGCDPIAVHKLVSEALELVEVAADPRHPEAFRPMIKTDIRDLGTLGAVLMGFVKLNFSV
jgi:hypothetical protein